MERESDGWVRYTPPPPGGSSGHAVKTVASDGDGAAMKTEKKIGLMRKVGGSLRKKDKNTAKGGADSKKRGRWMGLGKKSRGADKIPPRSQSMVHLPSKEGNAGDDVLEVAGWGEDTLRLEGVKSEGGGLCDHNAVSPGISSFTTHEYTSDGESSRMITPLLSSPEVEQPPSKADVRDPLSSGEHKRLPLPRQIMEDAKRERKAISEDKRKQLGNPWGYAASRSQQHIDVHSGAILQRLMDVKEQSSDPFTRTTGCLGNTLSSTLRRTSILDATATVEEVEEGEDENSVRDDALLSDDVLSDSIMSVSPCGMETLEAMGPSAFIRSMAFPPSAGSSPGNPTAFSPPRCIRRTNSQPVLNSTLPPRASPLRWRGAEVLTGEKDEGRTRLSRTMKSLKRPLSRMQLSPDVPVSPEGLAVSYAPQYNSNTSKYILLGGKFVTAHASRGKFGQYSLARERSSGTLYTVKVFERLAFSDADVETQKKAAQSITTERMILESHCSKYIMNSLAVFQDSANVYMVLGYEGGEDVESIVNRVGRFNLDVASFLLAETVDAITHLHSLQIAHRSLSPECLLLDPWGHIVLSDFGHAKANSRPTAGSRTICGQDPYNAPEMHFSKKGSGLAADWWSFGGIVSHMLSGKLPLSTVLLPDLEDDLARGIERLHSGVPSSARDLIARTMTVDPADRLDGDGVKSHPFFSHLDWSRVEKKDYTPQYRPNKFSYIQLLSKVKE